MPDSCLRPWPGWWPGCPGRRGSTSPAACARCSANCPDKTSDLPVWNVFGLLLARGADQFGEGGLINDVGYGLVHSAPGVGKRVVGFLPAGGFGVLGAFDI